jgi:hypothetical protein
MSSLSALSLDCRACHSEPFARVRDEDCTACHLTVTAHVSEVSISISYTMDDGSVYTAERFRGLAHDIRSPREMGARTWEIVAFDLGFKLAESRPSVFGFYVYTRPSSALSFINAELIHHGFGPAAGPWTDYSPVTLVPFRYGSVLSMIVDLANAATDAFVFIEPNGRVRLSEWDNPITSPFSMPLTCQTRQEPIEGGALVNRVLFTLGDYYYGAVYNDLVRQATEGVLRKVHSTNVLEQTSGAVARKGRAIVENSHKTRYAFECLLNPFIFPGETIPITLIGGAVSDVRLEKCVDTFGWEAGGGGGFWSSWEGRVSG